MQTTAGSLALVGSVVPGDAVIIRRLRNAGAVILGKTNLGEWANFRGNDIAYPLAVGWSARGGDTINAYNLSYTSWGSSSGSANGVAANLCSVAVGTETDGSITGPSSVECIVGLKPTLGLVSQRGNYSDFPSTGHGWANGPQRHRRCDSSQRIAVALRSRSWSALTR